jgi:protein-S-isoprenylcysteine O-methyltransferase Ste14
MRLFRVAREASAARHVAITLLQTAAFWSVFLWLLPELVAALGRALDVPPLGLGPGHPFAIGLFAAASALGLTCGIWMAVRGKGTPLPLCTAREFVVSGPYRYVRNPMALAGITQGIAAGLWRDDVLVVHYALAGALLWHFAVRPPEERDLQGRFGAAFVTYRNRVGLWLPLLPRAVERAVAVACLALALAAGIASGDGSASSLWRGSALVATAGLLLLVLVRRWRR